MRYFSCLLCLIAFARLIRSENTPGAPDPANIEHKVFIQHGQEKYFRFKTEGNRLLEPHSYKGKHDDPQMVKVVIMDGGPVPGRVLDVSNQFGRTLRFRVLERLEGKPEFAKISKHEIKIGPGQQWCHFTPEKSRIAEAVLSQFSLSDEPLQEK